MGLSTVAESFTRQSMRLCDEEEQGSLGIDRQVRRPRWNDPWAKGICKRAGALFVFPPEYTRKWQGPENLIPNVMSPNVDKGTPLITEKNTNS